MPASTLHNMQMVCPLTKLWVCSSPLTCMELKVTHYFVWGFSPFLLSHRLLVDGVRPLDRVAFWVSFPHQFFRLRIVWVCPSLCQGWDFWYSLGSYILSFPYRVDCELSCFGHWLLVAVSPTHCWLCLPLQCGICRRLLWFYPMAHRWTVVVVLLCSFECCGSLRCGDGGFFPFFLCLSLSLRTCWGSILSLFPPV